MLSDESKQLHAYQENFVPKIHKEFKNFSDSLQNNKIESKETILFYLIIKIINQDYYNLCAKRPLGRKRKIPTNNNTPPELHPFSSYLIDYAMKDSSTGLPEYRTMFKQIGNEFKTLYRLHAETGDSFVINRDLNQPNYRLFQKSVKYLQSVITVYNQHHPGAEVNLDVWATADN